jgi:hypothetical protein
VVAVRTRLSFRRCALAGFGAGCAVALTATIARGGSAAVQAAAIAAGLAAFGLLAFGAKIVRGREVLVSYHHSLVVLFATGLVAATLGAPVLDHLDATALGLAVLLATGRVGCHAAGCCHGRPARRGPVYTAAQVPPYLAGVALLPVPLLESAALVALAALGIATGAPLVLFLSGYAAARFALEELRGDLRPHLGGLSEARWTSLAVATVVALAAAGGVLPGGLLPALVAAALIVAAVAVARRPRGLLDPTHVAELMRAPGPPRVVRTSLGVLVSGGVSHYTLSAEGRPLEPAEAAALGHILLTADGERAGELVPGPAGVWHVLAH